MSSFVTLPIGNCSFSVWLTFWIPKGYHYWTEFYVIIEQHQNVKIEMMSHRILSTFKFHCQFQVKFSGTEGQSFSDHREAYCF